MRDTPRTTTTKINFVHEEYCRIRDLRDEKGLWELALQSDLLGQALSVPSGTHAISLPPLIQGNVVCCHRTNGMKFNSKSLWLNIRKNCLTTRVVPQWHRLPGRWWAAPFLGQQCSSCEFRWITRRAGMNEQVLCTYGPFGHAQGDANCHSGAGRNGLGILEAFFLPLSIPQGSLGGRG